MRERNMASQCSYHPGVSPKCVRKKLLITDIGSIMTAEQENYFICLLATVNLPEMTTLAPCLLTGSNFPALRKAFKKMKEQRL